MEKAKIEEVENIYNILNKYEYFKKEEYIETKNIRQLEIIQNIEKEIMYVEKEEGETVGCTSIHPRDKQKNEIFSEANSYIIVKDFAVDIDKQDIGIGKRMLKGIYSFCQERGIKSIRLTINSDDVDTNRFFLQNEFIYVGNLTENGKLHNCYERIL